MNRQFLRNIGALALCLLLAAAGIGIFQEKAVSASAVVSNKKLPIYCVQTDAPKVSISFDAAWGKV